MKKIYISSDVEGLNGITSFKQTLPEYKEDYTQMQPQLHAELNALIKGLKSAGIENIVINDAHNTMTNITLTKLPSDIQLISGKPKKVSMMYGLDESFDAVIFFGYHAKATSEGVLSHTFNINFKSVQLNGEKISEAQLNAIYAKMFNVPIVLASGDNIFCDEIQKDIGNIATIKTKMAISRFAATCEKNSNLFKAYEQTASKINSFEKVYYKTFDNYELKVEFDNIEICKWVAQQANLQHQDNFVFYKSNNYVDIYTTLQKISVSTPNTFF